MEKITNTSTMPKELEIPHSWEYAMGKDSWAFKAAKKEWRILIKKAMWDYFENNDQLLLEDFLLRYRIPRTTFTDMRKNHKDLADAVKDLKIFIAARRKNGAYRNQLNSSVWKDMHDYDHEWASVDAYHDNRDINKAVQIKKQDDQDKHGTIIVQMTKFTEEK